MKEYNKIQKNQILKILILILIIAAILFFAFKAYNNKKINDEKIRVENEKKAYDAKLENSSAAQFCKTNGGVLDVVTLGDQRLGICRSESTGMACEMETFAKGDCKIN